MTEFENLEQKLTTLVALTKQIKEENRDLRARAGELDAENRKLADKVGAARDRIEAMIARLPDGPEES